MRCWFDSNLVRTLLAIGVSIMPKTNVIVLNFGYAETAIVAPTIYHHQFGAINSRKEALVDLAYTLYSWYIDDYLEEERKCHKYKRVYRNGKQIDCPKQSMATNGGKCPECHTNFDACADDFMRLMYSLGGENCDGYYGDIGGKWWPYDSVAPLFKYPHENICVIWEGAEGILVRALKSCQDKLDDKFVKGLDGCDELTDEFLDNKCSVNTQPY
jgi:hypothetical protein